MAAGYFGLYFGVWASTTARAVDRGWPGWLVAPLGIYAIETLLEHVTLFPATWLHVGQVVWRLPLLTQAAELGGIQIVSFELVLLSAGLHEVGRALVASGRTTLARTASWMPFALAIACLTLSASYGELRLRRAHLDEGARVALVQGNVAQAVRNRGEEADAILDLHVRMSLEARSHRVDLVLWPESTSNHFLEKDTAARERVGALAATLNTYILMGALGLNPRPTPPSNSAFLIDPLGRIAGRADKRILVPFGETLPILRYIPPVSAAISNVLSRTMHFRPDLTPGEGAVVLEAGLHRVGTLICYEDTIPGPAEELARAGARALVLISNEAWFGQRELEQHLAMATIRSIETRLPMARATNTGLTAIIDPLGRVVQKLPADEPGVLVGSLPVTDLRPVPRWLRHALSFAATIVYLTLGFVPRHRTGSGARVTRADRS